MSVIEAAFAGRCGNCELRYNPGTRIRKSPEGRWVHDTCPADPLTLPAQPGEVVCKDCFLVHPIGACDL